MKLGILLLICFILISCEAPTDILTFNNQSNVDVTISFECLSSYSVDIFKNYTLKTITQHRDESIRFEKYKLFILLHPKNRFEIEIPYSKGLLSIPFSDSFLEAIHINSNKHDISARGYNSIFSLFTLARPSGFFRKSNEWDFIIK